MAAPALTLSTGSLYLYGLDRAFGLAKEAGFDGVEIMCDERLDTRQLGYLQQLVSRYQLPVKSLHAPFLGRRLVGWEGGAVAAVQETVALAEALEAAHVVMHLPDKLSPGMLLVNGRRLLFPWFPDRTILDWIKSGGLRRFQSQMPVKICLENLPIKSRRLKTMLPQVNQQQFTYWNTLEEWPQAHDYLTLDTTHWATHGIDPVAAYRAGNGQVRHVHLSNFRDGVEHQLPQQGELDLAGFLRYLVADGFDGQIVVELNPVSLEAVDEGRTRQHLAEAVAFCRAALTPDAVDQAS